MCSKVLNCFIDINIDIILCNFMEKYEFICS